MTERIMLSTAGALVVGVAVFGAFSVLAGFRLENVLVNMVACAAVPISVLLLPERKLRSSVRRAVGNENPDGPGFVDAALRYIGYKTRRVSANTLAVHGALVSVVMDLDADIVTNARDPADKEGIGSVFVVEARLKRNLVAKDVEALAKKHDATILGLHEVFGVVPEKIHT